MDNTKDTNPKDSVGSNKIAMSLVSAIAIAEEALALVEGGVKYGFYNYRAVGVRASIYLDAHERHIAKFKNGEDRDPVTGVHHLGSARACLGIILDAQAMDKLNDDRPPACARMSELIDALEERVKHLRAMHKDRAPRHYTIKDSQNPATPMYRGTIPPKEELRPVHIRFCADDMRPSFAGDGSRTAFNLGWLPWRGGRIPTEYSQKVEVQLRDGARLTDEASSFVWGHRQTDMEGDIVAYRLINNDWIDWQGGECPVPSNTRVEIEWRNGTRDSSLPAQSYDWHHCDKAPASDIVLYRVLKDGK